MSFLSHPIKYAIKQIWSKGYLNRGIEVNGQSGKKYQRRLHYPLYYQSEKKRTCPTSRQSLSLYESQERFPLMEPFFPGLALEKSFLNKFGFTTDCDFHIQFSALGLSH